MQLWKVVATHPVTIINPSTTQALAIQLHNNTLVFQALLKTPGTLLITSQTMSYAILITNRELGLGLAPTFQMSLRGWVASHGFLGIKSMGSYPLGNTTPQNSQQSAHGPSPGHVSFQSEPTFPEASAHWGSYRDPALPSGGAWASSSTLPQPGLSLLPGLDESSWNSWLPTRVCT